MNVEFICEESGDGVPNCQLPHSIEVNPLSRSGWNMRGTSMPSVMSMDPGLVDLVEEQNLIEEVADDIAYALHGSRSRNGEARRRKTSESIMMNWNNACRTHR